MESKLPASERVSEMPTVNYGKNLERTPGFSDSETSIERQSERFEQRSETTPVAMNAAPTLPAPVVAPITHTPATAVTLSTDDMPAVANDDDLIEKEWVDKAKKIIVQTKDDPYLREREVGKLQADYLRKRYGRELGVSQ